MPARAQLSGDNFMAEGVNRPVGLMLKVLVKTAFPPLKTNSASWTALAICRGPGPG